jgi:hypothetical protein
MPSTLVPDMSPMASIGCGAEGVSAPAWMRDRGSGTARAVPVVIRLLEAGSEAGAQDFELVAVNARLRLQPDAIRGTEHSDRG